MITFSSPGNLQTIAYNLDRLLYFIGKGFIKYNKALSKGEIGQWDDWGVRELCPVIDESGYIVTENDGIWAYYWGRPDVSGVRQIGLSKSLDNGFTWARYGSNPIISPSGVTGSWYKTEVAQPSVIKLTDNSRLMMAQGLEDTTSSLGAFSSTDGLSWSDEGQKLILAQFNHSGTAITEMGVPTVIKQSTGNYLVLFEAKTAVANTWRIFGAASSDFDSWIPMNSGQPLFTPSGTDWEEVGVANPHVIEVTSSTFLMAYNGIGDEAIWRVGFAYTTDFSSWVRYASNPILSPCGGWEALHNEACFLVKENKPYLRLYYHGFASDGSHEVGLSVAT